MPHRPAKHIQAAQNGLRNALAAHVGLGRVPFVDLAHATRIPIRRLYRFEEGTAVPRWDEVLSMIAVLGPEFANMLLEPVAIGGACKLEGTVEQYELTQISSQFNALWAEQLSDGVYCHNDWNNERPYVRRIHIAAGARLRHTI